ncbi:MAG: hypothetical protein ACT4TC_15025 [Myxococcaceae bacterium]
MALFSVLGVIFGLVQLVASIIILIDAFQKSVGKGFMTLCIPCYILYYMFTEFQHPKRQQVITAFFVGMGGSLICNLIGGMAARGV